MMRPFSYTRPSSVEAALEALGAPGARVHAGGTDLLGCLREGVFDARTLVSLSAIPALKGISETGRGDLRIGAMTTLSEVAASDLVRKRFRALHQGAASAASPQLRNQGTVGGNLCQRPRCWYFRGDFHCTRKGGSTCFAAAGENAFHAVFGGDGCFIVHPSDTAPALTAFGAEVRIAGPSGSRRVPLESFFLLPAQDIHRETVLEPGEMITEILVPDPGAGTRSAYRKVRERGSWDFALVGAAVVLRREGSKVAEARIVLSGVAPKPWRAAAAEEALRGATLESATIAAAAEAAAAGAVPLEHNAYKIPLIKAVVEEVLGGLANAPDGP